MVQHNRSFGLGPAIVAGTLALAASSFLFSSTASGQDEQRPKTEREVAKQQLEVMRMALPALKEADKRDAVELLQRAIRAREVTLEGRRDDEAQQIRRRAPNRGAQAKVLGLAARLWREFGNEDKAAVVGDLAEELGARERVGERPAREGPRREQYERPLTDREFAQRQLKVMRLGLHALREAERADAAELLARAIRAREVILEGRRDDEAAEIRERSPGRAEQAEMLGAAAQVLREYGQIDRARAVEKLADQLAAGDRGQRERREGDRAEREQRERSGSEAMERIERLEDRVADLTETVRALERHLRDIKRRLD